ncbi:MAG: hypothetical protein ACERKO_06810 [Acetanaerobacterium sp.]
MKKNLIIPERSRQAIPDLLDLGDCYTHTLDGDWLEKTGVNLESLERGIIAYAKSAFDLRGLIQLKGRDIEGPETVDIQVKLSGRKLHLLHGIYGRLPVDTVAASYVIHYVDGETRDIHMIYGRNVTDTCRADLSPLTDGEIIVLEKNDAGRQMLLVRCVYNNPRPEVEIASIDFVSKNTEAAPFLVGATLERNDPVYEWFDRVSVGAYNPILPRSPLATPDQVDLSEFYSTSLDDDWFHHSSHDLHDVPKGVPYLADTMFDVRGLVLLAGSHSLEITGLALPEAILSIPVHRKGKQVHFLHACGFASDRRAKVGEYIMHYADGTTVSAPIIYGVNIIDWWESDIVTDARVAWVGSHAAARVFGKQTHLIKYTWDNPMPEKEIVSFDFVTALENSAPFLVAVTVEA